MSSAAIGRTLASSSSVLGTGRIRSIADMLLIAGADPDLTSIAGRTCIHELFSAASKTDKRSVPGAPRSSRSSSLDMSSTRDANNAPETPQPLMSGGHSLSSQSKDRRERRSILRTLLHWSIDPFQGDREGLSALHYCVREDSSDCLLEMLFFMNRAPAKELPESEPPGFKKHQHQSSDQITSYKASLRSKCGPYVQCAQGRNALHTACLASAFKAVDILIRWDADNSIIGLCRVALNIASTMYEKVEASSEYSLATTKDCNGKTPFQLLGQSGRDEIILTFWEMCFLGGPVYFLCFIITFALM